MEDASLSESAVCKISGPALELPARLPLQRPQHLRLLIRETGITLLISGASADQYLQNT